MKHIIVDFNAVGQNARDCAIVDCSYLTFDTNRFDSNNPYTYDELFNSSAKVKLDVASQAKDGAKINQVDLGWWTEQPPEVKSMIKPSTNDVQISELTEILDSASSNVGHYWVRGIDFDSTILARVHSFPHWRMRDVASFIDGATFFRVKNNFPLDGVFMDKKYDTRHNVIVDVLRMQYIRRFLEGIE